MIEFLLSSLNGSKWAPTLSTTVIPKIRKQSLPESNQPLQDSLLPLILNALHHALSAILRIFHGSLLR